MKRSDSSLSIRKNLVQNLYIDKINNNLPIAKYFHQVALLFELCIKTQQENYLARSYCSWKQFSMFVSEELPNHKQYKLSEYRLKRDWCKEALTYATTQLELIVFEMDKQEDEVQRAASNGPIDLIDEFDSLEIADSISPSAVEISMIPSEEQLEVKRNSLRDALKILDPPENLPIIDCNPSDDIRAFSYPTVTQMIQSPPPTQNYNFLSVYEAEIVKCLWPIFRFHIPIPQRSIFGFVLVVNTNPIQFSFYRHDFQISYSNFLANLHPDLRGTKCAIETNRCFFIHLGVAMNIHPFALQTYFRNVSATRIHQQTDTTGLESEILQSCLHYAGFVDANCLNYIWPQEFEQYRILLISGSVSPIFTLFYSLKRGSQLIDILVHSDGSHFTLLKPISNENTTFSIIPGLLQAAKNSGSVVQEIVIDESLATTTSIEATLQSLVFS